MPRLGNHQTQYTNLSDGDLYDHFRSSVYAGMEENDKQALFQEVANRHAAAMGMVGSPEVRISSLPNGTYGEAGNGVIHINRDLALNGTQKGVDDKGAIIDKTIEDANLQIMNTVIHETTHSWQEQVEDGTIKADPISTLAIQSNSQANVPVTGNGKIDVGDAYLNSNSLNGYYFYYFQPTEEHANRVAELRTGEIIKGIEARHGAEKSFSVYADSVKNSGYMATLNDASKELNNTNLIAEIRNSLINQYMDGEAIKQGIPTQNVNHLPTDQKMAEAVRQEMINSRNERLQASLANVPGQPNKVPDNDGKGGNKMAFDPNHSNVTPAQYDAQLRGSVNAYYEHAMNDPSMSREDVIRETSQMAEKYLTEMENYTATYNEGHGLNGTNTGTNTGTSVNSGNAAGVMAGAVGGSEVSGGNDGIESGNISGGEDAGLGAGTGSDLGSGVGNGPDEGIGADEGSGPDDGGGPDGGADDGVE